MHKITFPEERRNLIFVSSLETLRPKDEPKTNKMESDRAEILDFCLEMNKLSFGIGRTKFQKISSAEYGRVTRFSPGPSLKSFITCVYSQKLEARR